MWTILKDPTVIATILGGVGWILNKIRTTKKDNKTVQAMAALASSIAMMTQFTLTEPDTKTPEEMIRMFKGIVAVQFANAKIYDLTSWQPLIDKAIAEAVTEWVERHPRPTTLKMPIVAKVLG